MDKKYLNANGTINMYSNQLMIRSAMKTLNVQRETTNQSKLKYRIAWIDKNYLSLNLERWW